MGCYNKVICCVVYSNELMDIYVWDRVYTDKGVIGDRYSTTQHGLARGLDLSLLSNMNLNDLNVFCFHRTLRLAILFAMAGWRGGMVVELRLFENTHCNRLVISS